MFCKSAFVDFIKNSLDDFLNSGSYDFRKVLECDLLCLFSRVTCNMKDLFAEALQPVRHTCSKGELYVFSKSLADLKFALDIVGDASSSERNRCIVSHDVAVIDGHRCAATSKVDKRHSILHLDISEHCLSCSLSCEIFLL